MNRLGCTRRMALVAALLLVAGAGCGGGGEGAGGGETKSAGGISRTSASDPGSAAEPSEKLDFEGAAVSGPDRIVGADHAGKDVVLWFWAPW